ncbi:MAG: hypothetical protein M1833_002729 [Piccolia ochrophora]|nr:MAG: hypothetical protein M1833_002729 [Piccolia ochrophora]
MGFQVVLLSLALLATLGGGRVAGDAPQDVSPDSDGKYTVVAPGIRASFVPYGASLSNLYLNDSKGIERDIAVGWDNASYYSEDPLHAHLGAVPGRYANRIKNASFEIDGQTYNVSANDNDGADSLHGGADGWDWRNFTVAAHTTSSITFSIVDPDGTSGYPGEVISYVTYTLSEMSWHAKMIAIATTKKTPIGLTQHAYWNLDGFQNDETPTALNHTLSLPYAGQRVGVDSILIPTGDILANAKGSVNDFWSAPKQMGASFDDPDMPGNCGADCEGYDNCYILNRTPEEHCAWRDRPVASVASAFTGIQMDVYTDQAALQVYSCTQQNGSTILKETQGLDDRPRVVEPQGCVVLEAQEWIDAVNHPEWRRGERNIFGPDTGPYTLEVSFNFTIDGPLLAG